MRSRATVLLLPLLLAGCVKAPAIRTPEIGATVPANWTATETESETVTGDWWNEFGDPSLANAIETALQNNHDLAAAAARLEQAEALARIAGAGLKPSVGAGVSGSRQRQYLGFAGGGDTPLPFSPNPTYTSFGASLDISWEVDLWGRLRADARAALADYQAALADLAGARLSLAGQTAKAYFAAAEAKQQVALAGETVKSWEKALDQVRNRYERGVRSSLDVRLSLTQLKNAEALLDLRRAQHDGAVRQLEVLMGRYPGRELEPPDSLPTIPDGIPGGLPSDLVSRRPDLAAAERTLAAADQRLVSARRSLYPKLSLTAGGGTASNQLSDLLDGDFRVWNIAGNLLQPIFQGGRLRAGVDSARAGTGAAVEEFAGAVLRAYAEVESTLASEEFNESRERHLAAAIEQARAAESLAQDRYENGLEDFITVLDSRRSALSVESQLLSARRARLDNRVDLYLALGGGFQAPDFAEVTP
jgi:NodT family efflux transporter outer membrane factor (OMF) lipoprotein